MGYRLNQEGFSQAIQKLSETYRIYAPVRKVGEGRLKDTDVIRYDEVKDASEIELREKSDYSFKEAMTPLSETLFYFTENVVKEADIDIKPMLVFLRSCDLHGLLRQDQIYLMNGPEKDWFYQRRRDLLKFVLIGCQHSFENCFCVSMDTNQIDEGYVFSVDQIDGSYYIDVKDADLEQAICVNAEEEQDVTAGFVTENKTKVTIPDEIPLEIIKHSLWDEYSVRCIGCGRCNYVCPTCTCYTMQDCFYTDNGKVGERRRVNASCMVDGFTNVAGGGQYRRTQGERMRFKVLHKIKDHKQRFGNQMCVGCGRCDDICPEYISYSNIINKVNDACQEIKAGKENA
jgi:anaerobic sulfite reductase subunit A